MAASCVHALLMLHSLQPAHGPVNFILAQLYVGVYSIRSVLVQAGRFTCRRRMIRGFRRKAVSATSSDLLLARAVSLPSRREVAAGLVQATKRWGSDWRQKPINRLIQVRIPCTAYVTPL